MASVADLKRKEKSDLSAADSWRSFEALLLTHAPPVPCPSPCSPRSPFSFLSPLRMDDTSSHLPSADFHLYGSTPISRANPLVLCVQCGQPVPPHALARHFDHSHATPPPSPPAPSPPLPLQPSHKLNSPSHPPPVPRPKHPKQRPPRPLAPPQEGPPPPKRFPSFLSDCPLPPKLSRPDPPPVPHRNPSFSFYAPSLPPAPPFRHLPLLPRPLAFSPACSGTRLAPSGLLLPNRSADRMHYALSQLLTHAEHS